VNSPHAEASSIYIFASANKLRFAELLPVIFVHPRQLLFVFPFALNSTLPFVSQSSTRSFDTFTTRSKLRYLYLDNYTLHFLRQPLWTDAISPRQYALLGGMHPHGCLRPPCWCSLCSCSLPVSFSSTSCISIMLNSHVTVRPISVQSVVLLRFMSHSPQDYLPLTRASSQPQP
jgi:hypothetical protein